MRRAALVIAALAAAASVAVTKADAATPAQSLTGNLLVLLDQQDVGAPTVTFSTDEAVGRLHAELAGKSVPQIGLITVRPPKGISPAAFAARLRRLPGVASVQPERRYVPRGVPDDPALSALDPADGVPWQWYLAKEHFDGAWSLNQGNGALVGVIDTGIDGTHPDLASKIAVAVNQQTASDSTGPADTDQVGHGTNVASLACADTNNDLGMAGAGYNCRLVIEKTDFSDSSIAASIVNATDRGVKALNMSFGPSVPTSAPAPASEVRALKYAAAHKVVLVAAAADSPSTEQGDPANVLQPAGTGPHLADGIGLDVTAARYNGTRAPFSGTGTEISLAAYGAFRPGNGSYYPCNGQPAGIFGAFPGNTTQLEQFPPAACRVDFMGDDRYATVAGTSMAAPQVAAVGAMMRELNPYASLPEILRIIKQTAQRAPHRGWSAGLGWGILNADAALEAVRRIDPPTSHLVAPAASRSLSFVLTWTGSDPRRPELIRSAIAYFQLYVSVNGGRRRLIAHTSGHRLRFDGVAGDRYSFFLFAVDRAGNRQLHASRALTRVTPGGTLTG